MRIGIVGLFLAAGTACVDWNMETCTYEGVSYLSGEGWQDEDDPCIWCECVAEDEVSCHDICEDSDTDR